MIQNGKDQIAGLKSQSQGFENGDLAVDHKVRRPCSPFSFFFFLLKVCVVSILPCKTMYKWERQKKQAASLEPASSENFLDYSTFEWSFTGHMFNFRSSVPGLSDDGLSFGETVLKGEYAGCLRQLGWGSRVRVRVQILHVESWLSFSRYRISIRVG